MKAVILLFTLFISGAAVASSELTPVTATQAQDLFNEIAANKEIPFAFPDGCYAKAQKIAMLLDKKGIVSEKAFVEGNIFFMASPWGEPFWTFHVAPVILVNTGTTLQKEVIDPFFSPRLLSYEEWLKLVASDSRTEIKSAYFTSRFVYSPAERNSNPTTYDPEFVKDMNLVFDEMRKRMLP